MNKFFGPRLSSSERADVSAGADYDAAQHLDAEMRAVPKRGLLRRRRFRAVPLRIILPNLVTLLALSIGLTSIQFAVEGEFETAVIAVIVAAILDGLDGRLARALRGTSRFGAELNSLADFVDFGVAPGLILYLWSLHQIKSLGWFTALVFAIACALRLARFSVTSDNPDRPAWQVRFFTGMPAPAGAIVGLLPLYLNLSVLAVPNTHASVPFEIAYVLFVAFLMASPIRIFPARGSAASRAISSLRSCSASRWLSFCSRLIRWKCLLS